MNLIAKKVLVGVGFHAALGVSGFYSPTPLESPVRTLLAVGVGLAVLPIVEESWPEPRRRSRIPAISSLFGSASTARRATLRLLLLAAVSVIAAWRSSSSYQIALLVGAEICLLTAFAVIARLWPADVPPSPVDPTEAIVEEINPALFTNNALRITSVALLAALSGLIPLLVDPTTVARCWELIGIELVLFATFVTMVAGWPVAHASDPIMDQPTSDDEASEANVLPPLDPLFVARTEVVVVDELNDDWGDATVAIAVHRPDGLLIASTPPRGTNSVTLADLDDGFDDEYDDEAELDPRGDWRIDPLVRALLVRTGYEALTIRQVVDDKDGYIFYAEVTIAGVAHVGKGVDLQEALDKCHGRVAANAIAASYAVR